MVYHQDYCVTNRSDAGNNIRGSYIDDTPIMGLDVRMTAILATRMPEAMFISLVMLQVALCYEKPVHYCQKGIGVTGPEDFEVVDTYVGEETTIYYDDEGTQHVEVNDNG